MDMVFTAVRMTPISERPPVILIKQYEPPDAGPRPRGYEPGESIRTTYMRVVSEFRALGWQFVKARYNIVTNTHRYFFTRPE